MPKNEHWWPKRRILLLRTLKRSLSLKTQEDPITKDQLHRKWSFPLRISTVNVTKFTVSCGFGHIYWRNPQWKTSFFVQWPLRGPYQWVLSGAWGPSMTYALQNTLFGFLVMVHDRVGDGNKFWCKNFGFWRSGFHVISHLKLKLKNFYCKR